MAAETVAIGADHAGVALKKVLKEDLVRMGYAVIDMGTEGAEAVDYPDYAFAVSRAVAGGQAARGVLVCGTGIGMSIAANRERHVRAAAVCSEEAARLARAHNDANVLCLGARLITEAEARACLETFMRTDFEGGRHERRVGKLS